MKKHLILLLIFFSAFKLQAQPFIVDCKELDELENATLYIIIGNPNLDANVEYADVFIKYWTLCPVKVIEYKDMAKNFKTNSYFMTPFISYYDNKATYTKYSKGYQKFQLIIWKPKAKFVEAVADKPSKIKNLNIGDNAKIVAGIDLKADDSKRFDIAQVFEEDFMGKGFMSTSGQGMLKNYLQNIQLCIKKELFYKSLEAYSNPKELLNLKTATLYIPSNSVNEYKNDGDENKENTIKETHNVAEDYPYKFELISLENLNELIMKSEEPVYYLTTYLDLGMAYHNIITITNSETGEIIFTDNVITTNVYSSRLMKILTKQIEKSRNK